MDGQRHSAIQAPLVVDQFVQYPGRCATAHHHLEVLAGKAPIVAEVLEGGHEVRLRGVHPWEFVDENDLTLAVIFLLQGVLSSLLEFIFSHKDTKKDSFG